MHTSVRVFILRIYVRKYYVDPLDDFRVVFTRPVSVWRCSRASVDLSRRPFSVTRSTYGMSDWLMIDRDLPRFTSSFFPRGGGERKNEQFTSTVYRLFEAGKKSRGRNAV